MENGQKHIPRIKLLRLLKFLDSNIDELNEYLRSEETEFSVSDSSGDQPFQGNDVIPEVALHVDVYDEDTCVGLIQTAQEIRTLASGEYTRHQREAMLAALTSCLNTVQRVRRGEISIPGNEDLYFKHLYKLIHSTGHPEFVKTYVNLTAFKPIEIGTRSWFETFYMKLEEDVVQGKVEVEYVFLLDTVPPVKELVKFMERFKRFARKISIVSIKNDQLSPDNIRPNVTLLTTQRTAITFDRDTNKRLIDVVEWIFAEKYQEQLDRYESIEWMSTPYFVRPI
jgi:hypothetical protein